ncbi:MAG: ergothioneine biosynthesis protein EgtB [Kofleriaceae bacterium]|nr:ergothioneine biosynthesis protein EgtB [Kofleriaceae bacterium]
MIGAAWAERFRAVRARTEALAAPLSPEDQQLQSMPACSPTKWHRAHTSWFFEAFVLAPRGVAPVDARAGFLWNSYYEAVGPRHPRPQRGLLSRPSGAEVATYRRAVDDEVVALLARLDDAEVAALAPTLALGLAHEEQHQELILTDALHALAQQPFAPRYRASPPPRPPAPAAPPLTFTAFAGGLIELGHRGHGFAFDNEGPAHRAWLAPYALADRMLTVGEVRAFAADGGYRTASLWLAAGWDFIRAHGVAAPAYIDDADGGWHQFGLDGRRPLDDGEPATFVSLYEADAIARWLGARLPTEAEWEHAARDRPVRGGFLAADVATSALAARPAAAGPLAQLYGEAWQWTASPYAPYPGYRAGPGALGEYNGKFMIDQHVLRGGSCFTPPGHVRSTYRNFWPADTRFQVTGVRVARDA